MARKCPICNGCLNQVQIRNSFYVFFCDFCKKWFDYYNKQYTAEEFSKLIHGDTLETED